MNHIHVGGLSVEPRGEGTPPGMAATALDASIGVQPRDVALQAVCCPILTVRAVFEDAALNVEFKLCALAHDE